MIPPGRRRLAGWLLDLLLIALCVMEAVNTLLWTGGADTLIALVGAAGVLVRRRLPWVSLALALPAMALGLGQIPTLVALFSLAVIERRRWPLVVAAAIATIASLEPWVWQVWWGKTASDVVVWLFYGLLYTVGPIALGLLARTRGELFARLDDLAAARHAERQLLEAEVLAVERARISREMHDVVSHQVSLIAVQAGALQVSSGEAATRESAGAVRSLAVRTLDELRQMLGVLRATGGHGDGALAPQPGVADLDALVRASGIETRVEGSLPGDLPAPVQRAVYRTVQEGLTNARKHAPGAPVGIELRMHRGVVSVVLRSGSGHGARVEPPLPSARHGLVGLRERAELLGGALETSDGPDGFTLRLRVPAAEVQGALAAPDHPRMAGVSGRSTDTGRAPVSGASDAGSIDPPALAERRHPQEATMPKRKIIPLVTTALVVGSLFAGGAAVAGARIVDRSATAARAAGEADTLSSTADSSERAADTPVPTADSSTAAPEEVPLPLSDYLTAIYGDNYTAEELAARESAAQRAEELVAQCMREQGFEYYLVPPAEPIDVREGWEPDDRDWAARYGYGVIDSPVFEAAEPNANEEYITSLTIERGDAYWKALAGESIYEVGSMDGKDQGCSGWAYQQVGLWPGAPTDDGYGPLHDAISQFYEGLETRPGFAPADAAWAACMTEAGRPGFTRQPDAQATIDAMVDAYWASGPDPEADPAVGTIADPRLAAVAAEETALAVVDLECRERVDYRAQQLLAKSAAEIEFVEANRAGLEALKAAAAS